MTERAHDAESKCDELRDWVDRLLEYMDIPEEEMRKTFQKQKSASALMDLIANVFNLPTKMLF